MDDWTLHAWLLETPHGLFGMLRLASVPGLDWLSSLTNTAAMNQVGDLLTPTQYRVIAMRFGIDSGFTMSLDTVARELSVSRVRVREHERQALQRLREFGRK